MLRPAALALVVATLAVFATGAVVAERAPAASATRAGLISALRHQVCDLLDGVETVELPFSIANFVKNDGELEASTVILFGTNKLLCGGGRAERVLSLAHDWLLGAITHDLKLPAIARFKLKLPTLVPKLVGLPTLGVKTVSLPTATFSGGQVDGRNLMPLTVNWVAAPLVDNVYLEAVPLSSRTPPFTWRVRQNGLVGAQSAPLGLSSGRWKLCIRPATLFKSANACGYPFWINLDTGQAATINSDLLVHHNAHVGVYGSQIGVEASSAHGSAYIKVDPACSNVFACYRYSSFDSYDGLGFPQRFFAYWAWNLGESCHGLNISAPTTAPLGPAVAGHVVAVVSISSLPFPRCRS